MKKVRPNIILILTDQQRFDTIAGIADSFGAKTPNLDRLASRSMFFTNMFCTTPICGPSRSSLFTGLYPNQTGLTGNIGAPSGPMNPGIPTIARRLQAAGCDTAYHGKWHVGGDLKQYGWDHAFECSHDPSTIMEAGRFLRDRDWLIYQSPFFQVVSLLNPHDIYTLDPTRREEPKLPPWPNADDTRQDKPWPQRYRINPEAWPPDRVEAYKRYYAELMERLDHQIGELLYDIYNGGFGSNTFIIFTSDHGDMALEHGIPYKGPYMYDGLLRVPFMVAPPWPEMGGSTQIGEEWRGFEGRRCDELSSLIDLVPTLLDIAGEEPEPDLPGRSLLPCLRGGKPEPREAIFAQWHQWGRLVTPVRCIRTREWKYSDYREAGEELYNLINDPHEMINLAETPDYADQKEDLRKKLRAQIEATGDLFFSLHCDPEP